MDTNRFSARSGDVTEIPGTSQVSETQPQPTVVVPKHYTRRFRKRYQHWVTLPPGALDPPTHQRP
jgi:hypothetical protein